MTSPAGNPPPFYQEQGQQSGTTIVPQTTLPAIPSVVPVPSQHPGRLDLFLYISHAIFALVIPAIQENTGMGFDSWWMRGALLGWIFSLLFIAMEKPTMFHLRGLRMMIIVGILIICGIVSFGLKQTYVVLPVIIDVGIVLACQDLPEDNSLLLPRQAQDLNRA
ncbi:hypothetical protein DL95DRAFT_413656 [Leptodontidium sp. 2 PMI_412]|nr:hypothetical protein DL95DRAFT_413656 [Leptodontidium sp. 2 PMI_412]